MSQFVVESKRFLKTERRKKKPEQLHAAASTGRGIRAGKNMLSKDGKNERFRKCV